MNKSNISVSLAGTEVDSNSTAQNTPVSQPNANMNVVGSLFSQREIKFRAWDGEKMHEGIVPWHWDFVISLSWHKCEKSTGNGILGSGGKTAEMLVPAIRYEKLMQYTGLKDKNGKEIYEGDILKSNYSLPLVIVFSDGKFCFYNSQSSGSDVLSQMRVEKLDVIGNIFENPELLQTLR